MTKRTIERQRSWGSVMVAVLLAGCLSAPAWAAPRDAPAEGSLAGALDPVSWVGQWFEQVTTGLDSIWQRSGCKGDPDGTSCPDESLPTSFPTREVEKSAGVKGSADGAARRH
jgi:hypothetical protein